jgi:hypothetical protein
VGSRAIPKIDRSHRTNPPRAKARERLDLNTLGLYGRTAASALTALRCAWRDSLGAGNPLGGAGGESHSQFASVARPGMRVAGEGGSTHVRRRVPTPVAPDTKEHAP